MYHTRTYANVHIHPPNWTYANIRKYASNIIETTLCIYRLTINNKPWSNQIFEKINTNFINFEETLGQAYVGHNAQKNIQYGDGLSIRPSCN